MPNILEAKLLAEGKRFALVVSRFNEFITDRLVGGAIDALVRSGALDGDIDIIKVPGAFEIPLAAKKMAAKKRYHAIVCLGAIIRGATPHFDYVSAEVLQGDRRRQPRGRGADHFWHFDHRYPRAGHRTGRNQIG